MKRAAGFTLIEMLVAMVILVFLIGAIYGTYRSAHTAMTNTEEREDLYQTARVLLAQMQTELSCAYQSAGAQESALTGEDTEGGDDTEQADTLTFLTTGHVPVAQDVPAGDLCQVSYSIDTDDEGRPGLYLEEHTTPGLEIDDDAEPQKVLLSDLVIGLNCKYMTPSSEEWETEWTEQTALPHAVRVELVLKSPREGAQPITVASTANLVMATNPQAGGDNGR